MPVEATRYEVAGWGFGELWMRGTVVLAHEFRYAHTPEPRYACSPKGAQAPPTGTLAAESSRGVDGSVPRSRQRDRRVDVPLASDLVERFRAFFAGAPGGFEDIELDLARATTFQRELTRALRAIPPGEVVTYGELAALAGRPRAARAAGTFCATNRFALLVPCHRVVAADGIGGYGLDGVWIKRRLLAMEGVEL